MLCEKCKKKKATFFYNENINGKIRSFHLCAECTSAMQASGELEDLSTAFSHFRSPFAVFEDGYATGTQLPFRVSQVAEGQAEHQGVCPLCGTTVTDIVATGLMGCAQCYDTFSQELAPAIRAAHGTASHTGKIPRTHRLLAERRQRLSLLKKQLAEAVSRESFEEAAVLRDEIRAMEQH